MFTFVAVFTMASVKSIYRTKDYPTVRHELSRYDKRRVPTRILTLTSTNNLPSYSDSFSFSFYINLEEPSCDCECDFFSPISDDLRSLSTLVSLLPDMR